jgi:hypothetical protein
MYRREYHVYGARRDQQFGSAPDQFVAVIVRGGRLLSALCGAPSLKAPRFS